MSNYLKTLLKPNGQKPAGKRVWGVGLDEVWLPVLTATNTIGSSRIPHEAMGAPVRLAYNADGTVKFSKAGRPVVKVVREIADNVKLIRENFVASLLAEAHEVFTENPDAWKAEVEANQEAGLPIVERDRRAMTVALIAKAEAEAETEARTEADKVAVAA